MSPQAGPCCCSTLSTPATSLRRPNHARNQGHRGHHGHPDRGHGHPGLDLLMPSAPPRVCRRCRRPAPKNGVCPCRPAWENSTHPSGHDRRWQLVRDAKKHDNPICERSGCRRPTTDVDHITPLAEGGDRYAWVNLQSLCSEHHTEKTALDAQHGKTRLR